MKKGKWLISEIQTLWLSFLLWKDPAKSEEYWQHSSSVVACPAPVHEVVCSNHYYNSHLHKYSSRKEEKKKPWMGIIVIFLLMVGIVDFIIWYSGMIYKMFAMKAGEEESERSSAFMLGLFSSWFLNFRFLLSLLSFHTLFKSYVGKSVYLTKNIIWISIYFREYT